MPWGTARYGSFPHGSPQGGDGSGFPVARAARRLYQRCARRAQGSDLGGIQRVEKDVQGFVEVVAAPDQLTAGRETDATVVAALGKNPRLGQVAVEERGGGRLRLGPVACPPLGVRGELG